MEKGDVLNYWFLSASAAMALVCTIHLVVGGRFVARPLLAADGAGQVAKYTSYYCWHLVSAMLAGMTLAFLRAGIAPGGRELAAAAVLLAVFAMLWSFAMIGRYGLRVSRFPQGVLFAPVVLLGVCGLWV